MQNIVWYLPNPSGGDEHTAVGVGQWIRLPYTDICIEPFLGSAGGTATVKVHASNIGPGVVPSESTRMATFILSGANDRKPQPKPDAVGLWKCAEVTDIGGGAVLKISVGA